MESWEDAAYLFWFLEFDDPPAFGAACTYASNEFVLDG